MAPSRTRALDWVCAAMIFTWGVTLIVPGDTLALSPAYIHLLDRFPETVWAIVLIAIGLLRFVALIVTGYWGPSPMVRGAAALMGAIIWANFLYAFVLVSATMGVVSSGVTVCLVLLVADLYSTSRAAVDFASERRRNVHRG
jgi:hypothetical protein